VRLSNLKVPCEPSSSSKPITLISSYCCADNSPLLLQRERLEIFINIFFSRAFSSVLHLASTLEVPGSPGLKQHVLAPHSYFSSESLSPLCCGESSSPLLQQEPMAIVTARALHRRRRFTVVVVAAKTFRCYCARAWSSTPIDFDGSCTSDLKPIILAPLAFTARVHLRLLL